MGKKKSKREIPWNNYLAKSILCRNKEEKKNDTFKHLKKNKKKINKVHYIYVCTSKKCMYINTPYIFLVIKVNFIALLILRSVWPFTFNNNFTLLRCVVKISHEL